MGTVNVAGLSRTCDNVVTMTTMVNREAGVIGPLQLETRAADHAQWSANAESKTVDVPINAIILEEYACNCK